MFVQRRVGQYEKAVRNGDLITTFERALADSGLPLVDVTGPLSMCIAQSDADSILNHRRAGELLTAMFRKFAIPRIESVIDEDQKITHQKLADLFEDVLQQPQKHSQLKLSSDISTEVESAYAPIVQSGGKYDLKASAASNSDLLSFDCIIVQCGVRHRFFGANAARTFLVNPSSQQEKDYDALLELFVECQRQIKPGQPLSSVYTTAERWLKDRRPDLLAHFGKNCGHLVSKLPVTLRIISLSTCYFLDHRRLSRSHSDFECLEFGEVLSWTCGESELTLFWTQGFQVQHRICVVAVGHHSPDQYRCRNRDKHCSKALRHQLRGRG